MNVSILRKKHVSAKIKSDKNRRLGKRGFADVLVVKADVLKNTKSTGGRSLVFPHGNFPYITQGKTCGYRISRTALMNDKA